MSGKKARAKRRESAAYVRRVLHAFIVELRGILKRRGPEMYRRFPKMRRPCATCAFNPATDAWRGADKTAWNLCEALRKDAPFYCHEGMRIVRGEYDPTTAPELLLCGGWLAVAGDPEAKRAFGRAVMTCMREDAPPPMAEPLTAAPAARGEGG